MSRRRPGDDPAMTRRLRPLLLCFALIGCAIPVPARDALGEARPDRPRHSAPAREAARPAKLEPYDPDRVRAGSRPGFIDLGNGTEVRIGGRTRLDYDTRR